jgi:hypothetical protein
MNFVFHPQGNSPLDVLLQITKMHKYTSTLGANTVLNCDFNHFPHRRAEESLRNALVEVPSSLRRFWNDQRRKYWVE